MHRTKVTVSMFLTFWLLRDGKEFRNFCNILNKINCDRFYLTEFMKVLVQEYWAANFDLLIRRAFLPWLVYFVSLLLFTMTVLQEGFGQNPETKLEEDIFKYSVGCVLLISAI